MAQFDVYQNVAEQGWLIDIQHDLMSALKTRLVVPLIPVSHAPLHISRLNPVISIEGSGCVMMTHWMSAVPADALGRAEYNLFAERDRIVVAVDMLVTGI